MFGLRRWSSSVDVVIRIDAIKATKVCPLARHVNTSVAGFFGSEIDRRYWLFIELRCVAGKLVSAGIGIGRGEHKGGEGDLGGDHDAVWVGVSFLELMTRSTWLSLGIVGYAAAEILRRRGWRLSALSILDTLAAAARARTDPEILRKNW